MALRLFADSHWSAITPVAPLRRWRLIELQSGESLVSSPLCIDERILHFLSGISYLDDRLKGMFKPDLQSPILPPSLEPCVEKITACWNHVDPGDQLPIIQLCGQRDADMQSIAQSACQTMGLLPYYLDVEDVPKDNSEREALVTLWQREALLDRAVIVIRASNEHQDKLNSFIRRMFAPCMVLDKQPIDFASKPSLRIDVPTSNSTEQIMLWQNALGEKTKYINGGLNRLVSQFNLTAQNITNVSQQIDRIDNMNHDDLSDTLWQQCRIQSRKKLDSLAQRINVHAGWDDLIIPVTQKQLLKDIVAQTRQRYKVFDEWGFSKKSAAGQGISALFYGPSGTGKTMAAGVMANALQLDLYRIDLSQVVNKYIGETEKNLGRVFDAAEDSGAILLFDEADALFAKRTEVKNSHDRNANMETSYLLQRMENYCGVAILTTNLKKEMDTAFMRRIRFAIPFPFPDVVTREQIWQRVFPSETPLEKVDIPKLASLEVAGGNIHNIALNAAFLAAETSDAITMAHLAQAARRELGKLEKTVRESELRSWA
jgi:adenylate kinase family enzyme